MSVRTWLEFSLFLQAAACVGVLTALFSRGAQKVFPSLGLLLAVQTVLMSVSLGTLFFRQDLHLTIPTAYMTFYWSSWGLNGVLLILRILTVYAVFAEAMRPLSGLHEAGKIVFRWVGVVSGVVAVALVAGPGTFSSRAGLIGIFSHLQQGVSVLTLCLLIFVCFAVRPLGLTFRSHIFGVALGLGVASTVELIQAAWLVTYGARPLYSPIYLFTSIGMCTSILVWGVYFGMPDPARRMILLPTTSPFFFWNRISEILGDSPGHVAVAGFTPDMLAQAEIEMLTSATAHDGEQAAVTATLAYPTASLPSAGGNGVPTPSLA